MDDMAAYVLARLLRLPASERATLIRGLALPLRREFNERWWQWAHRGQFWPEGEWQPSLRTHAREA